MKKKQIVTTTALGIIAGALENGKKIAIDREVRIYIEGTAVFISEVKMLRESIFIKIEKVDGSKSDSAIKPLASISESDQWKIAEFIKANKK